MPAVSCTRSVIDETIEKLRNGGRNRCERVVLWLAPAVGGPASVTEVYEPEQETARDRFYLPPESMKALMGHLRGRRLKIVAQIHTHPAEAFHSVADDTWAIIRHEGALSLVLPYFARATTPDNFLLEAMVYALSSGNEWEHVPQHELGARLEVKK